MDPSFSLINQESKIIRYGNNAILICYAAKEKEMEKDGKKTVYRARGIRRNHGH